MIKLNKLLKIFAVANILLCLVYQNATASSTVRWISVQQLKESLDKEYKNKPINVGFDIDDTVLFSSPSYFRGYQLYCKETIEYYKNQNIIQKCLTNQKFWNLVNTLDTYNIPKESAVDIIKMHLERKDNIYFITMRPKTKKEKVTEVLQQFFNIPKINSVIFLGNLTNKYNKYPKANEIKSKNIKVFYGDADSDIASAQKAGARGIRLMRPANSLYKPIPEAGSLGEEVVINSDR